MTREEILSHVDHTLLKPEATWPQIQVKGNTACAAPAHKTQAARVSLTRAALLSYARLIQTEHLLQLGLGAGHGSISSSRMSFM